MTKDRFWLEDVTVMCCSPAPNDRPAELHASIGSVPECPSSGVPSRPGDCQAMLTGD